MFFIPLRVGGFFVYDILLRGCVRFKRFLNEFKRFLNEFKRFLNEFKQFAKKSRLLLQNRQRKTKDFGNKRLYYDLLQIYKNLRYFIYGNGFLFVFFFS